MVRLLNGLEEMVRAAESGGRGAARHTSAALAEALGANGAYLLYGEDGKFHKADENGEPPIKNGGYFIVNRFLATEGGSCAFNVEDGMVVDLVVARPGLTRSHVAGLLPLPEGTSEMVIVHELRDRISRSCLALFTAAGPILAQAVAEEVDAARSERRRLQMSAFADVAMVLSRSQSKQETLSDLCTAVSGASGIAVVSIAILDSDGEKFAYRALNEHRYSDHPATNAFMKGAFDAGMIAMAKSRKPWFRSHLAAPDSGMDHTGRRMLVGESLFASMAGLPLVFRDELLGVMTFSSFRPHPFEPDDRMMLQSLAAQAATIVKGLTMYEELRDSKNQLQRYAERLQDSMGIEYRLARTDPLTGLPNRRYLKEAMTSEFDRHADQDSLCLIMTDVDRLKEINDGYGHLMGDDVLKVVGSVAWRTRNQGELVGRFGGDEFLFIIPGRSAKIACEIGEQFRSAIEQTQLVSPSGEPVGVTVSVGVAEASPNDGRTQDDVIEQADQAMYAAKRAGGNRVNGLHEAVATTRSA